MDAQLKNKQFIGDTLSQTRMSATLRYRRFENLRIFNIQKIGTTRYHNEQCQSGKINKTIYFMNKTKRISTVLIIVNMH